MRSQNIINTPVLLLIFNRPEKIAQVFERVRHARPSQLFVAADGPRADVPGDARRCEEARNTILDHIDWDCEIHTLLRNENLGCKLAVSSAITWFFEQVEEGIILEDDCLPDPTFFPFCAELLDRYRDDKQVMMVSGDNFLPVKHTVEKSYFFSRSILIWGWATWRRAWEQYDLAMSKWPEYRSSRHLSCFLSAGLIRYWEKSFDFHYSGKGTTWDVQWVFTCWQQESYCIVPAANMVQNIGDTGVHMKPYDPCINLPVKSTSFPLRHPDKVNPSPTLDRILMHRICRGPASTVWYIALFLFQSATSRKKNLWRNIRQTADCLTKEMKSRYLS